MKKLLLALVCVAMVAGVAYADLPPDPARRIKTVVVAASGVVSTSTINSNDLILGFSVTPLDSGTGISAALVDAADVTTSVSTTYVFDEIESSAQSGTVTKWFPYAKSIATQLGVYIKTASTGYVTIYYEDK